MPSRTVSARSKWPVPYLPVWPHGDIARQCGRWLRHSAAIAFPDSGASGPAASCSSSAHPGVIDLGSDPTPWASSHRCTVIRRPWQLRHRRLTKTSATLCPAHSGCSRSINRTGFGLLWPQRHRTCSHRPRRVRIVQASAMERSKGGLAGGMTGGTKAAQTAGVESA